MDSYVIQKIDGYLDFETQITLRQNCHQWYTELQLSETYTLSHILHLQGFHYTKYLPNGDWEITIHRQFIDAGEYNLGI